MVYYLHEQSDNGKPASAIEYDKLGASFKGEELKQKLRLLFAREAQKISQNADHGVLVESRRETDKKNLHSQQVLRILAGENGVFSPILIVELTELFNGTNTVLEARLHRVKDALTGDIIRKPDLGEQVFIHVQELFAYLAWIEQTGQVIPNDSPTRSIVLPEAEQTQVHQHLYVEVQSPFQPNELPVFSQS